MGATEKFSGATRIFSGVMENIMGAMEKFLGATRNIAGVTEKFLGAIENISGATRIFYGAMKMFLQPPKPLYKSSFYLENRQSSNRKQSYTGHIPGSQCVNR